MDNGDEAGCQWLGFSLIQLYLEIQSQKEERKKKIKDQVNA